LLVKKGDHRLLKEACVKFVAGVLLVAILVFLPAGTLHYPGAWLLMAVLFIPMFFAGLVMWRKAPALLESRLQAKERESQQKQVIGLSALMFLGGFILAGLDHRYHWTAMPKWLSVAAAMVFLLGYLMFAEVLRENAYLSRTVEVREGQTVVSTGLYGVIRHPMYSATLLMFLAMPLVLGSVLSFFIMLAYIPIIVKRIRNEEEVLTAGLPGYAEYKSKVKYRLIPFVW
jgi:protein-S-isoprenylcysteine O-methyltransferase Ste14